MESISEKFYEDHKFNTLNFENKSLSEIEFVNCTFKNCNFKSASFLSCTFTDCTFETCDLSMAKVTDSSFKNTKFVASKLTAIDWTRANWGNSALLLKNFSVNFENCQLNYATFMGLSLKEMKIENCFAIEVDFSDANLTKASFRNTDLAKAIFRNTDLSQANFVGAINYTIVPNLNTIKQAKFSLPEAISLLQALDIELVDEAFE